MIFKNWASSSTYALTKICALLLFRLLCFEAMQTKWCARSDQAGGWEIIKMIEDAIFLPWPLKHADWSIYNLSVRAALLTHPRCIAPGVENANEMEREKQSGKWNGWQNSLGWKTSFPLFFGLPSLLFPRLHWRKCIKIGGDRNSISWQCFAIVYLIYLQIVPFLEFAKKINCHLLTFNPYHFDSKRRANIIFI